MDKKTEALKLALNKVQEFKSRWCKVPPFADRVNKATRDAITLAQVPIFELEHALREALAEQPAQQQEPLEYWNAVEGWVKIDEVREHFDSVGCGTIYKTPGDGRVPLTTAHRKPLTVDQVWQNDQLMSLNAELGCSMDLLMEVVEAIEAAHGIKENT